MPDLSTLSTAVRTSVNVYKYRHQIQNWWKRLEVWANEGDTNIAVMGRPAVGKSVLVADLHGEAKDYLWSLPDTSTDVETMAIELSE